MSLWLNDFYNGAALSGGMVPGGCDMGGDDLEGGFDLMYPDLDTHAVPGARELANYGMQVAKTLPQRNLIALEYSYSPQNPGQNKLRGQMQAFAILGLVYYIDSLNAQYIMNVGGMRRAYKAGRYGDIKQLAARNTALKAKMREAKGMLTNKAQRHYFNKFRKWMHGSKTKMSSEDYRFIRDPGPYQPSFHLRPLSMKARSQAEIDAMLATYEKKHPNQPFPSDKAFAGLEAYKKFADAKMGKEHKPLKRKKRMIGNRDLGELVAQIAETNPAAAAAVANAVANSPPSVPATPDDEPLPRTPMVRGRDPALANLGPRSDLDAI